jgi:hypothetical protein
MPLQRPFIRLSRVAFRRAIGALAVWSLAVVRALAAQDSSAVPLPDSTRAIRPVTVDSTGADIVVIFPDSLPDMPRTMSELLAARVPGLFVQRSTGAAGASSWISMRDAGAVQALEPLVVVDGVRRASTPPHFNLFGTSSNTLAGERVLPSLVDDIPVDQVERVEILHGPAAAARYGRDGRYGVIVVTTRRPASGRPQLRASLTGGVGSERADFPANFAHLDANGNTCTNADAAAGRCTQVGTSSYSVLRDRSPFASGTRRGARLDATAGLGIASFAFGATHDRADGVLPMDGADHTAVTARAHVPFGSRVRLSASAQTSLRGVSQPAQGSSTLEIISGGIYGPPIDCSTSTPCASDTTSHGYRIGTPEYLAALGTRRRLQHFSEGAVLEMIATPWLTSRSSISFDGFANRGKRFDGPLPGDPFPGISNQENVSHAVRSTLEQSFRGTWTVATLQATTTLAVRNDRDRSHETTALVQTRDFNGTVLTSGAWSWSKTRDRRTTVRLEQRASAGDRVSAGGGLLWTRQKAGLIPFGLRATLDGFADASVLLIDPATATRGVRSLRLRAAAGQISGYDPRVLARAAFVPIFVPPTSGPPEIKPLRAERALEIEGGIDAEFAPANLRLSLTAYRRNDADPYLPGPVVPPGYALVGDMRRRLTGVELSAGLTLVDVEQLRWTVQSQLALTNDRVTHWQLPPMFIGGGRGAYSVIQEGKSFGGWSTEPLTFADTNGNGVIETSEITPPQYTDWSDGGHSRPTRTAALQSSIVLLRALTIGAQLDYVGGHKTIDLATVGQCLAGGCVALNDPRASLAEQARGLAAANGFIVGYLESASAVRLRELSVSLFSARMASLARAGSLRFTLAGRNLATWSRYHGLDPETDLQSPGFGSFAGGVPQALYLPNTRQLTARLTLSY